jgi:heat shock protein HslJ
MQSLKETLRRTLPLAATAFFLAACLLASGCTGQNGEEGNVTVPGAALDGTSWKLLSYEQNGSMTGALEGTTVTLIFGGNATLSGAAGCNLYSAGYTEKGTAITVGPAVSTLMYCGTPGVMEQESAYLGLLGKAASFAIEGETLTFMDDNHTAILTFEKAVQPEAAPLVGTNWTLASVHTGDTVSSVIAGSVITAVFGEDGSLTGSAGCNRYFASYNLTGVSLSIGQIGSTKMACTAPEGIMEQETVYLNTLGGVKTYAIEGDRLELLDEDGVQVLTFTAKI